jgi:AraC-like DNA-binding protein
MSVHEKFALRSAAIDGMTLVEATSNRSFSRHIHDQFGVGLLIHGAQVSFSGRGEVQAHEGDVITVNPGEVHDGRPIGGVRCWQMLYLDPGKVESIALALDPPRGVELHHPVLIDQDVTRSFVKLLSQLRESQPTRDYLALETALLSAFAPLLGVPDPKTTCIPAGVRTVRAMIEEAPEMPLSLDEMSRLAGLGRYQFLRIFKRATGLPPCSYRLQLQLQMARRLILAGTPLAVVSRMLWKFPGGALRACEGSVSQAARSRGIGSMG